MCEYCHSDVEGYFTLLPRRGTGNARIRHTPRDGALLEVNGPNRTCLDVKIKFCPMCGEKLREENNER